MAGHCLPNKMGQRSRAGQESDFKGSPGQDGRGVHMMDASGLVDAHKKCIVQHN